MANVQPENGVVPIAHDLYLAIASGGFTAIERSVIDAVIYFTYGAQKPKAVIAPEDVRYLLASDRRLRNDRLTEAITGLLARRVLYRQELVNGKQLLAIQKDYDLWVDKLSTTLQDVISLQVNNNNPIRVVDKMSSPERLLDYVQVNGKFKYSIPTWRMERKWAKRLYVELLAKTKNPDEAYNLIIDYIDENEWMRLNVKFPFAFMYTRFEAWRSQIPRKPREIRENEEATGRRYRYNVKLKQWRPRHGG